MLYTCMQDIYIIQYYTVYTYIIYPIIFLKNKKKIKKNIKNIKYILNINIALIEVTCIS